MSTNHGSSDYEPLPLEDICVSPELKAVKELKEMINHLAFFLAMMFFFNGLGLLGLFLRLTKTVSN